MFGLGPRLLLYITASVLVLLLEKRIELSHACCLRSTSPSTQSSRIDFTDMQSSGLQWWAKQNRFNKTAVSRRVCESEMKRYAMNVYLKERSTTKCSGIVNSPSCHLKMYDVQGIPKQIHCRFFSSPPCKKSCKNNESKQKR